MGRNTRRAGGSLGRKSARPKPHRARSHQRQLKDKVLLQRGW